MLGTPLAGVKDIPSAALEGDAVLLGNVLRLQREAR